MASTNEVLLTSESTFKHKVSSTLNRSAEFGSKHLFDGLPDTCWNSDQGASGQFILIDFCRIVQVTKVKIMFQGGFTGIDGSVEGGNSMDSLHLLSRLNDIEDTNGVQTFTMYDEQFKENNLDEWNRYLRINFASSTDFYGRITIYNLEVHGIEQVN